MAFVSGGEDESNIPFAYKVQELIDDLWTAVKLSKVPLLELVPFFWIVVKPSPKFGAWRYLLEPIIKPCFLFG